MTERRLTFACWFLIAVCTAAPLRADWPGWRGAKRDGVVTDFQAPSEWPATLEKGWSAKVGEGHASPILVGGRVFQLSRLDEKETMTCLSVDGNVVWRKQYPAPYRMHNAARNHGKGPRSTPVVADGRVYSLGVSGILSCWRVENGELLWRQEFSSTFPKTSPLYGTATSPLIAGEWCLAHVGGHEGGALTAFRCRDGKVAWDWRKDGPSYASPVVAQLAGVRQIVTQSQKSCLGVDERGNLLWSLPFDTDYSQNSVTPVIHKDIIIVSGYNRGVAAHRIARRGRKFSTSEVWSTRDASMYMSSPVLHDGRLYGFSQLKRGQLFCLDVATGKVIWTGPPRQGENAALLIASPWLVSMNTTGELIVCRLESDAYDEVQRYRVSERPVWAHPVLHGRRILVKDVDTLTQWTTPAGD